MKVLFITNQVKTYNIGFKNDFEPLLELKHEIFWAANFSGFLDKVADVPAKLINLPIRSNPLAHGNRKAYKALIKEVRNNNIDVIICSTPIGGFLGRLVAKKTKTKVIYAAHGLLFFKGAPFINNTLYKLQERIMARWTDVIITINNEDFAAMSKIKKKSSKLYLVHGAGVDVDYSLFENFNRNSKLKELSIPENSHLLVSIGFLNKNKNYKVVINALSLLQNSVDVHYIICGEGSEKERLTKLAKKLGVFERIHFLGYRTDVFEIIKASDLVIVPSFREGVPRVILEAMNLGIPCIGSDTRGIRELIGKDYSQLLCNPRSPKSFSYAIEYAFDNPDWCKTVIKRNFQEAQKYTSGIVRNELLQIYKDNI